MLPGLSDTSWPARLAIFAALVGHAFAPRPLEGPSRTHAADRARPEPALPERAQPDPPPPVAFGATLEGERARPAHRVSASAEPAAEAPGPARPTLRLSGLVGESGPAPAHPLVLGEAREESGSGGRAAFPAFSWRLEGRTVLGFQLGRVRDALEGARHDEVPRGFGVRAVLSF